MSAFDQTYLNTGQLLAWVYLGDRTLVERAADDPEGEFGRHEILRDDSGEIRSKRHPVSNFKRTKLPGGGDQELSEIFSSGPVTALTLVLAAAVNKSAAFKTYDDAKQAVLNELENGRLHALGLKNGAGSLIEIAPTDWPDLKLYWGEIGANLAINSMLDRKIYGEAELPDGTTSSSNAKMCSPYGRIN